MANMFIPPAIPTLTVGGRVFTDLENLIQLIGHTDSSTYKYTGLTKTTAAARYQVPVGKKLQIRAVKFSLPSGAINLATLGNFGYCDNDVGISSTTAPTNPVYCSGDSNQLAAITREAFEGTCLFEVPAGKYLLFTSRSAAEVIVQLFAYEVPA